jgi:hypothetical protein
MTARPSFARTGYGRSTISNLTVRDLITAVRGSVPCGPSQASPVYALRLCERYFSAHMITSRFVRNSRQ